MWTIVFHPTERQDTVGGAGEESLSEHGCTGNLLIKNLNELLFKHFFFFFLIHINSIPDKWTHQ